MLSDILVSHRAKGRVVEGPAADRFCPWSFLRFFDDNDDAILSPEV